jgi:FlaA1/EpsC-like NDP-sugar epimerase
MQNLMNGDIEIEEIGLRPGEKLHEELLISGAPEATNHPRIFKANENFLSLEVLEKKLITLEAAIKTNDRQSLINYLCELVPDYSPRMAESETS